MKITPVNNNYQRQKTPSFNGTITIESEHTLKTVKGLVEELVQGFKENSQVDATYAQKTRTDNVRKFVISFPEGANKYAKNLADDLGLKALFSVFTFKP